MKCRAFFSCIIFAFLNVSCATFSQRLTLAGDAIIGKGSDVFVFVPVGYHKNLFSKLFPSQKYIDKAIDRTNYLYISLKMKDDKEAFAEKKSDDEMLSIDDEGDALLDKINFNICAVGRYPKSIAGLVFSKKNGWKKEKSSGGYIYFQKNSSAEGGDLHSFFSIPTKNIALFSHNSSDECRMENLIDRLNSPRPSPFGIDFELAMQQGDDSSNICIFVANPHFFLSKLIGIDLDLPIENLKVYLNRNTERAKEFYNYTVILEVQNISAGFATRLLLSKLLKSQVRIEENKIIVEKAKITKDRLLEIIKRVVFK